MWTPGEADDFHRATVVAAHNDLLLRMFDSFGQVLEEHGTLEIVKPAQY